MSAQEPQKRLVGWKQYLRTVGTIFFGKSFAMAFRWGGLICFGFAVFTFALLGGGSDINGGPIHNHLLPLLIGSLSLGLFLGGMGVAQTLFKKVEKIEPVELLTKQNAKHLPEVETLVRGSESPAIEPQNELLRATGQGVETPPEQLLRAAKTTGQDG